jgi:uncharacterized membrane protein (UPF0182 family)
LVVEQFSVKPNAAQKESEYISRSITATRQAYGLTAWTASSAMRWNSGSVRSI